MKFLSLLLFYNELAGGAPGGSERRRSSSAARRVLTAATSRRLPSQSWSSAGLPAFMCTMWSVQSTENSPSAAEVTTTSQILESGTRCAGTSPG